jgi:magnesium-transporting ATPase (P-type)
MDDSPTEARAPQSATKTLSRLFMKRVTMLSVGFSVIVAFFYAIGNFQNFLDETQLLLLSILTWCSLISIGLSLIGMVVLSLSRFGESLPRRISSYCGYLGSLILSLALVLLSYFLKAAILG